MIAIHSEICKRLYFKSHLKPFASEITLPKLAEIVSRNTNVSVAEIRSKSRLQNKVHARQILCYIAFNICKIAVLEIGKFLNRDHTTVVHSHQKVSEFLKNNDELFTEMLKKITKELNY